MAKRLHRRSTVGCVLLLIAVWLGLQLSAGSLVGGGGGGDGGGGGGGSGSGSGTVGCVGK